ncbi:leucyl aminopeptidase family protein [Paenarthrobacter sp. DKR-5]|uniref:leucyl aminopeptidase family protein n=1 Tax=Paenarthrobacter sp. DKR-5 TaxID=2835535 RepID=UPI001BDCB6E3|nr:leucyl aminopeptidase family protein [Paenarthrobacter sp. DKR-5]MBT1002910.1 leucyl aminopeptidase family protein [Paenarthrobacter sp. DKR-5]
MNSAATREAFEKQLLEPALTRLSALGPFAEVGAEAAERPDVLAVPIGSAGAPAPGAGTERPTPQPRRGAVEAAVAYHADVAAAAEFQSVTGKAGEVLSLMAPREKSGLAPRLILLGVGEDTAAQLRKAGAALAKATFGTSLVRTTVVDGLAPELQRAFLEGFLLGGYRAPRAGTAESPKPIAARLEVTGADEDALIDALSTAEAVWLTRSLANTPSNLKNPEWLAAQARRLAADAGLECTVRDEVQLQREGFGGLLAVGSGSATPPRLVQVSYTPEGVRNPRHVVLVGKGITFDTGGISLKPRESMVPMKTDMAGAAVVLAVTQAAARLGLDCKVTALLALAENAVSGSAYRPGDIVKVYDGTTVEIGNTDAEGRMVLADGMGYAVSNLAPDILIDVATLTGAASMGLGRRHGALYGTSAELVSDLERAAEASGERVWHMPLEEVAGEYRWALDSDVADIAHITGEHAKVGAGSITAALFLREFAGDVPWAHLDIAGPGRAAADEDEVIKGATGYGTRLLVNYLQQG